MAISCFALRASRGNNNNNDSNNTARPVKTDRCLNAELVVPINVVILLQVKSENGNCSKNK